MNLNVKVWGIFLLVLFIPALKLMANLPFPTPSSVSIIPAPPGLAAKSFLLIDFSSNHIIAEQHSEQRVEPASLTKMMTVYVADQALRAKKVGLKDNVKISEKAWRTTGSRMFVEVNTEVSLEDLLKGIIIQSGNDASIAVAEHIAGSETSFSELMNYYAAQLGMTNTHFTNATGLPDPNHYTTARDMAMLAKALIRDFPETYKLYSQKEFMFHNIKQTNRNRLLWEYDWVDGIKTGHTEAAGYCLVASGLQNGMRLIAVVMGTQNETVRSDETNKLLTYGFRFYETRKLYPKDISIKQARVWMGKEKELNLGLADDLYVTIGKGQYDRLKANIQVMSQIKAPTTKGAVLGSLSIQLDDKTIVERPIIALQAIEKANIFYRLYDRANLTLQGIWDKVRS